MFYIASKVVFFCIAPSHVCLIALGLGALLLMRRGDSKNGRRLVFVSLAGFVVLGFAPVGVALMLPLEQRFPPPAAIDQGRYDGIILLGGFEDGGISKARNTLALIDAGERLSETVRLAHKLPQSRIIFSGGAATIFSRTQDARDAVSRYLRDVGIGPDRTVLENQSRNTWENAVFTKRLVKPRRDQRFLLVTSAWHMPRAIGIFRKVGFDVVAYPVDYRTQGEGDLTRPYSTLTNGLRAVDQATKEWIGLLAYWISGRSSALFPRP